MSPLTRKGKEILRSMESTYKGRGPTDTAKRVFYASINSGKIKGAEKQPRKK